MPSMFTVSFQLQDEIDKGSFYKIYHLLNSLRLSDAWCIYASVKYTIIASDDGLSPVPFQAIIWINAGIFSFKYWRSYFSEIFS